ncbi:cold-shock protein [Microcoleus sp.]|uniref:cold-shock protein n=1 Tax=Microcoleus sp. TaxID=44472 RepID=UPI003523354A
MTIDFGSIKGYNPDRGFGFVGHTFFNPDGKVFFHIKKIRRKHPELAQKLDSGEAFETFNFWYEIETTEKGEQVSKLWLNADDIPQSYTNELCGLKQKVESIWKNIGSPKPSWLDHVTIKLVGVDCRDKLSVERDNLESQLRAAEEERRREAEEERRREAEEERRREAEEEQRRKAEEEQRRKARIELLLLLKELRPLKFKYSNQLSAYIAKNQLGYRYPNISGIVRMAKEGKEWDFKGGFHKEVYKIICRELGLANQGTSATATKFTSYQQLLNRK